jgi:antitoxin FitA
MSTITLKNIPRATYNKINRQAGVNRRSINNEIIHCIEQSVLSNRIDVKKFLADIKKINEPLHYPLLTEEMIQKAKNEGRP